MSYSLTPVLRTLESKEIKQFQKFASAYLSNQNQSLLTFLIAESNRQTKTEKKDIDLAKKYAAKLKVPFTTAFHRNFRKKKKDIKKILENFLLQRQMDNNPLLRSYLMSNFYSSKNLHKHFKNEQKEITDMLKESWFNEAAPFSFQHIEVCYRHLDYYSISNPKAKKDRAKLLALTETSERYFLLQRLFLQIEILIYDNTLTSLEEQRLEYFRWEENYFKEIEFMAKKWPLLAWLVRIYETYFSSVPSSSFETLFKEFKAFRHELDVYQQRMTIKLILNIANYWLNINQKKYVKKIFVIYQFCFNEGLLPAHQSMEENVFINIAIVAILSEEYEWYNTFTKTYGEFLFPKDKYSVLVYCEAFLNYQGGLQKNDKSIFDDIIYSLQTVKVINPTIGIRIRSLEVRIYYEINEKQEFMNSVKLMRQNLKERNILSKKKKTSYNNFTELSSKLWKLKEKRRLHKHNVDEMARKLIDEVDKKKLLVLRHWLKEKLGELLSSPK